MTFAKLKSHFETIDQKENGGHERYDMGTYILRVFEGTRQHLLIT